MEYIEFNYFGTNCVGVLGVKENGAMLSFNLSKTTWEDLESEFGVFGYEDHYYLNVFANGKITITENEYDNSKECYIEEETYEFKDKAKERIVELINEMLEEEPIYKRSEEITSYQDLLTKLKDK